MSVNNYFRVVVWSGKKTCVAGRSAQIKEKTTAVSKTQESGLFCSSRQNLSTLSSLSLFSNLTNPYLYSVTRAARNTSIVHIQIASLGNKTSDMCVSLPASNTVLPTMTEPIKAWLVSNESLKNYLLIHINRMYK